LRHPFDLRAVVETVENLGEVREVATERDVMAFRLEYSAVRTIDEYLRRLRNNRLEVPRADREESVRVPSPRHARIDLVERQCRIVLEELPDARTYPADLVEHARAAIRAHDAPAGHEEVEPTLSEDRVLPTCRDVGGQAVLRRLCGHDLGDFV